MRFTAPEQARANLTCSEASFDSFRCAKHRRSRARAVYEGHIRRATSARRQPLPLDRRCSLPPRLPTYARTRDRTNSPALRPRRAHRRRLRFLPGSPFRPTPRHASAAEFHHLLLRRHTFHPCQALDSHPRRTRPRRAPGFSSRLCSVATFLPGCIYSRHRWQRHTLQNARFPHLETYSLLPCDFERSEALCNSKRFARGTSPADRYHLNLVKKEKSHEDDESSSARCCTRAWSGWRSPS